jgi:uncharacterized protein
MIVLDTTILLYAAGAEHPLHDPCLLLLDRVEAGLLEATTTVEVIQEFAHVRSRRRSRHDAAGLARSFARLLAPVLSPTASDVVHGLDVFEAQAGLGAFDCVLAAASITRSAQLASADKAFSSVPGLAHVAPGTPQFDELLG